MSGKLKNKFHLAICVKLVALMLMNVCLCEIDHIRVGC